MPPPHETLFFLTGGTGPRPTHAAFLAAAAQRTTKTAEVQREKALRDAPGVGPGVMRFLGLRRVGEKGVRKGRGVGGRQVEKNGEASGGGGGDTKKDAGGTSKGELARDAASSKEPEKGAVENDIVQSAGYDAGTLPDGETCSGAHHGTPGINFDGAGDDGHVSIGKGLHTQDGEVEMLLDADELIASTPRLLDSDKDDGEKAATADDIEGVAPSGTHISPSQEGQSIHDRVHSHIQKTPPVLPVSMELKVDSDINPDDVRPPILVLAPNPDDTVEDSRGQEPNILQVPPKDARLDLESEINPDEIHQPIVVSASDPDDSLDSNHDNESAPMSALLQNALPESESDTNPNDIRTPIIVPAPDPDDSSDPIPSNNTLPGLETDINPDDIRSPILVPGPDPDDSAEGIFSKDKPAEFESSINPNDIQPPIIVPAPASGDNTNDSYDHPPEIPPNLSASLALQDADLNDQIQHDVRDRSHQPPIFRLHGRRLIFHTHMMETIYSRRYRSTCVPGNAPMKCFKLSDPHHLPNSVS
ncbi:hypothetical protein VF21_08432 [Pseudogymnoascus sp. 05NY08]|nr:hypothetical protein VF21_08432 [Pseudogymnoascus sp. 05NY08]